MIRFGLGFGEGEDAILCNYQTATFPCHCLLAVCDEKMLAFPLFSLPLKNTQNSDNPHQSSYYCPMLVLVAPLLSFFLLLMSIFSDGRKGLFELVYVHFDYVSFWSGQR